MQLVKTRRGILFILFYASSLFLTLAVIICVLIAIGYGLYGLPDLPIQYPPHHHAVSNQSAGSLRSPNGYTLQAGDLIALKMPAILMTVEHVGIYEGVNAAGEHYMLHNMVGGQGVQRVRVGLDGTVLGESKWWARRPYGGSLAPNEILARARSKVCASTGCLPSIPSPD